MMYFPYLRGRQFEVIAIRELLENDLISKKIVPVVEPVKLSSTLIKTMKKFIENDRDLIIIHNPIVGSFSKDIKEAKKAGLVQNYLELLEENSLTKGHIVNKLSSTQIEFLVNNGEDISNIATISTNRDALEYYKESFSEYICKFNLIPDDRKFGRIVKDNKVLLTDRYSKRQRNLDYKGVDEFFSDDHLYFEEEGYIGYSDFSIVGDEYSDSGFAPYSVAIHIVYFNDEKELNLIHFVSDTNDDIRDPGGKFYEALSKMVKWGEDKNISTYGYKELLRHHKEGTYPGLGVLKKLCIMHHIELVSRFLEEA